MKICITSLGVNLDSPIDSRFGRAQYFLILDEKGKLEEALLNPGIGAMGGAGIAAAQTIANKGATVLITGNIGPNAFGVLNISKIQIFLAPPRISNREAFEMWKGNKLTQVQAPSVSGHFGMGPSAGPAGLGRRGGPSGQASPGGRGRRGR